MILDDRRRLGMRVFHIDIDGIIIAFRFPVGWDRNAWPVPRIKIILKKESWPFRGVLGKVKLPFPVQGEQQG